MVHADLISQHSLMIEQQQTSLLDAYTERDKYQGTVACDLCNLNFLQFAMKYRLVNGKLVDQPDNVVPRVYPTYSSNPKSTNFGLYCKYQLLTIL